MGARTHKRVATLNPYMPLQGGVKSPLDPPMTAHFIHRKVRDKVMDKVIRTKSIKVWLTPDEHQRLLDRKTTPELATWVRQVCLDEKPNRRLYKKVDPELLRELGRIGGNLNQLAKYVNVHSHNDTVNQLQLVTELALIREALNGLLVQYDS
jgi:hypothetical protein